MPHGLQVQHIAQSDVHQDVQFISQARTWCVDSMPQGYQHMGWGLTQTSINTWLPEGMPGAIPWVPLFSNCCIDGQLVGLQKPHSCAQTAHTHTPSCSPLRLLLSLLQLLRTTAQGFKLMGWDIPAVVQRWTKGRCCGPSGCTATITLFAVAVAAAGYCAAAIAIAASNC